MFKYLETRRLHRVIYMRFSGLYSWENAPEDHVAAEIDGPNSMMLKHKTMSNFG